MDAINSRLGNDQAGLQRLVHAARAAHAGLHSILVGSAGARHVDNGGHEGVLAVLRIRSYANGFCVPIATAAGRSNQPQLPHHNQHRFQCGC